MSSQRVVQEFAFEASHFYQLSHLSAEENARIFGKTARHHGHNYRVRIEYSAPPQTKPAVWEQVAQTVKKLIDIELDHRCLNLEHPYFQQHLPTTESLAVYLWHRLSPQLAVPLERVEVFESKMLSSAHSGETQSQRTDCTAYIVELTRAYTFSSAHRLYHPELSEEENRAHFGKCANPHGHGHDYRLEITVRGRPDPLTGMVISLADLDALVQREILDVLDHRFLNEEVPPFNTIPPTSENLVIFIVERLAPHFSGAVSLARVRLYETSRSYFEWVG